MHQCFGLSKCHLVQITVKPGLEIDDESVVFDILNYRIMDDERYIHQLRFLKPITLNLMR